MIQIKAVHLPWQTPTMEAACRMLANILGKYAETVGRHRHLAVVGPVARCCRREGMRLGLAISRTILESHQGSLRLAESSPNGSILSSRCRLAPQLTNPTGRKRSSSREAHPSECPTDGSQQWPITHQRLRGRNPCRLAPLTSAAPTAIFLG